MAYTKLNLKDYIDKWDAAKVEHLENGIIDGQALYTKLMNMSSNEKDNLRHNINSVYENLSDNEKQNIRNIIKDFYTNLSQEEIKDIQITTETASKYSDIVNIMGLWGGLLSEMGKKCGTPSLTWDGNYTNKILMPCDFSDLSYYVKLSDNTTLFPKSFVGFTTWSGLAFPLICMYLMTLIVENGNDKSTEDIFTDIFQLSLMATASITKDGSDVYPVLFTELDIPVPFIKIFTEDQYIDDVCYPKGTYVLIAFSSDIALSTVNEAPSAMLYVDGLWSFESLNTPMINNNLNWDCIDFHTDIAVTIKNNSIIWNGSNTLPAARIYDLEDDSYLTLISYKTKEFLELAKTATSVTTLWSSGTTTSSTKILNEKSVYVVGGLSLYIALDFFTITNEETGAVIYSIPPGVYLRSSNSGTYPKEIIFNNVNHIESILYSHKLSHALYDCPAYEEVHTIPGLVLTHKYNVNDDSISINFTDLNNTFNYHKLYDNPLILDDLKQIEITQPDIFEYSVEESTHNQGTAYPFVLDDKGYYISTNQGIPNSSSSCNIRIKSNNASFKIQLIVSGENGCDYCKLSLPTNESNSGISWEHLNSGTYIKSFENVSMGDYINIQYVKDGSVDTGNDCLRFKIIYNDIKNDILNSEQQISNEIVELSPSIQALEINDVNQSLYYYPLLNILENTEFEGITLTKGVYSITLTPNIIPYYISKVSTIDKYNTVLHKLDEKFLPEEVALKDETISIPQTATVGQILSVKAIDENGKPIEWETIDLPKAAAAITDATGDTVSAEQFNTLLASLRAAGYLAIE